MAIIDDYSGIAAELRRFQAERMLTNKSADAEPGQQLHPMRSTSEGERLYWRLVARARVG